MIRAAFPESGDNVLVQPMHRSGKRRPQLHVTASGTVDARGTGPVVTQV
jgi:hypothetical protein